MKTSINKIKSTLIAMMIISVPFISNAQTATENNELSAMKENESEHVITKFSSDFIAGKVNLNWTAVNMQTECVYQVERSSNAKDYEVIATVNGNPTFGTYELLYTWVDNNPLNNNSYYRISVKENPGVTASVEKLVFNNYSIQTEGTAKGYSISTETSESVAAK
jgi:hypothetical protein